MGEWDAPQKASLLLEVVKLCDKELLGYLVQCLHQRYTSQIMFIVPELVVDEKRKLGSSQDLSLEVSQMVSPTEPLELWYWSRGYTVGKSI